MDTVQDNQQQWTMSVLHSLSYNNSTSKSRVFCYQLQFTQHELGETVSTPFKPIPVQGDELTFDNLSIGFQVSENLENYIELQLVINDWISKSEQQFATHRSTTSNTSNTTRKDTTNDIIKYNCKHSNPMFSDATLTILSNKNNPLVEVRFEDLYPTTLSALEFTQEETDVTYIKATSEFTYKYYEIITL